MVDNNCTKGGANCTNTVGSFNCICQTRYFWNGMKCEGLFTLILFNPYVVSRSLSHYFSVCFSLLLSLSLGPMFSLCHNTYHWTVCVSVFLSVCLIIVHFARLFIFPSACDSLLTLKRRNWISGSFSFWERNSNGNN